MNFYTNVQLVGDNLLYLGYEEGQRIQRKFKFSPTLFVVTKKQTKFKTLDGRYAKPVRFESVREARQFVDKYKEVPNFEVYKLSVSCEVNAPFNCNFEGGLPEIAAL